MRSESEPRGFRGTWHCGRSPPGSSGWRSSSEGRWQGRGPGLPRGPAAAGAGAGALCPHTRQRGEEAGAGRWRWRREAHGTRSLADAESRPLLPGRRGPGFDTALTPLLCFPLPEHGHEWGTGGLRCLLVSPATPSRNPRSRVVCSLRPKPAAGDEQIFCLQVRDAFKRISLNNELFSEAILFAPVTSHLFSEILKVSLSQFVCGEQSVCFSISWKAASLLVVCVCYRENHKLFFCLIECLQNIVGKSWVLHRPSPRSFT